MAVIGKSDWPRGTAFLPDSAAHHLRTRFCRDAESRIMSVRSAGSRKAGRSSRQRARRLASFSERSRPHPARGAPLRDPGGGLRERSPDGQTAPRTAFRARRCAFRGLGQLSGRAAAETAPPTGAGRALRDAGDGTTPAVRSGVPTAAHATKPDHRARIGSACTRRSGSAWKMHGISAGCGVARAARRRDFRARFTRDNGIYRE